MSKNNTHHQMLRSTSIIGASSVINIIFGLIRTKAIALLLGPTGVGLYGLLHSIMTTATTLAGMGLGNSGVRQIAVSIENPELLERVSKALWYASLILGVLAVFILWITRDWVAQWLLNDQSLGYEVAGIAIGVLFSLLASSQTALLQGLRKIKELAIVSIGAAFAGTVIGIFALWWLGELGIVAILIASPVASVIVASYYTRMLLKTSKIRTPISELLPEWRALVQLGLVFMLTALMTELTHLTLRTMITKELGLTATGHFQASWAISMQYINFVLGAMAADYYPRLTQAVHNKGEVNTLVSQQIEFSLLLAAPIIILMVALAPWVISLLYSEQFYESVSILRWQILGDVFKVASWPMGFILLARAEKTLYFTTQTLWLSSYLLLVWLGLPYFGLEITGIAFLVCYIIGFAANCLIVWRVTGFTYRSNIKLLLLILSLTLLVMISSYWNEWLARVVGILCAAGMAMFAFKTMSQEGSLKAITSKILKWIRRD